MKTTCLLLLFCLLCSAVFSLTQRLRSYHPHYLHSYSYPKPSTLHVYYGRVNHNSPVFLIQTDFEGPETEMFVVDNKAETYNKKVALTQNRAAPSFMGSIGSMFDFSAPIVASRFMLVFSLEDSSYGSPPYTQKAQLYVSGGKYIYSIVMSNGTKINSYNLHICKDNKTLTLDEYASNQIKVQIRDVSSDPKSNWRISRSLSWQETAFTDASTISGMNAFVFQIQVPASDVGRIRCYLNQVQSVQEDQSPDVTTMRNSILKHNDKPFDSVVKAAQDPTCEQDAVLKLFRGMSYQYGVIHTVHEGVPTLNDPKQLFSFSPSRKRFPWGFLWDDGFHTEVAARTDPEMALRVIKSWLGTMIDGWIPRQQRRGTERQQLCNCPMFLNQDDRDGNPPSLALPLDYLMRKGYLNRQNFDGASWKKLKDWHAWFLRTQMTSPNSYVFKWFDHIPSNGSFNSGLDDFPRPASGYYYVDTQCWMYFFTKVMVNMSQTFEDDSTVIAMFEYQAQKIKDRLRIFLNPATNTYVDIGTHGYHFVFSKHVGYPSLLPLAFGMIDPDSPAFQESINLINDRQKLNSGFGLTSISQSSKLYLENHDAYWKGPVWMNINYLVLRGLKLYYPERTEVYQTRRSEIVSTVCGEWDRTGFFFENYIKGLGSFSSPFNGWTSTIALIVNEKY